MQEERPKSKINFLFTLIMCIIVGVAEFFILKGGYLGYTIVKNGTITNNCMDKDKSVNPKEEDTLVYLKQEDIINGIAQNGVNKYVSIDLDNDGYEELLTYSMIDEAHFDLMLYKGYDKGLVQQNKLLSNADSSKNFIIKEEDKDYIVLAYANEGVEKLTRVYYEDGKLKRRIVANHMVDDYEYLTMIDSLEWITK